MCKLDDDFYVNACVKAAIINSGTAHLVIWQELLKNRLGQPPITKMMCLEVLNVWEATSEGCLGDIGSPSSYAYLSPKALEKALLRANWQRTSSRVVNKKFQVFKAPVLGSRNVVSISELPENEVLTVRQGKGGKKYLSVARGAGQEERFTYLIVGEQNGIKVVIDFYPGEPVELYAQSLKQFFSGAQIFQSMAESMEIGWAKIEGE